ncbi:MAG: hypothetical protein ACRC0A_01895 [Chitinophagaceae bacterium]
MATKNIIFIYLLSIFLFSCSLKPSLTEKYTMFMMESPLVNYPIIIDSNIYMDMINKDFKKIDTTYYSLLYDQDKNINTTYLYLGKYDMGSNYDGILYAKIRKQSKDTIINLYVMVSSFDSFSYKLPIAQCVKKRDTFCIEKLIVHNDEFEISGKTYIYEKLDNEYKLNLKLRQDKKSKLFRIDTMHLLK